MNSPLHTLGVREQHEKAQGQKRQEVKCEKNEGKNA
jgi:hypothetical protein